MGLGCIQESYGDSRPLSTSQDMKSIVDALSAARLEPYLAAAEGDDGRALEYYRRNVLLCEAMYPTLHFLEVTLRNRFEILLIQRYGGDWYINPVLTQILAGLPAEKQLRDALNELKNRGRSLTSGGVVAELSFGFWTGLLGNRYRGKFSGPGRWILFPRQPVPAKGTGSVSAFEKSINAKLWNIRYLRNRVFHHEPIWADPGLARKYQDIRLLVSWICPEVLRWSDESQLDRFPEIYHQVTGKELTITTS